MENTEKVIDILQNILQEIEEGVHVINEQGITILYNEAMAQIEGLEAENVIGNHVLDVFPSLTAETSTLYQALTTGQTLKQYRQSYLNKKGQKISSINTTIPFMVDDKAIMAIEIAKNITKVSDLSDKIIKLQQKLINNDASNANTIKKYTFDSIVGRNSSFIKAIGTAKRASRTSSSVLIYGDTGTGKELFSQSIHYESDRKDKPFIAQNCGALPESLLEGILFGTAKGGFTGAIDRPGLFEQANGGTLFLDEINSMDLALQAKLLRVLQEGYVRRVGGLKDIPVDVRIIAATNEEPKLAVEQNKLRKDLFYRINVIGIKIPPLKERKDDIPLLVEYFISYYNRKLNRDVWMLSEDLLKSFTEYNWPGNVRELQNFIESSMNMITDEHVIKRENLPSYIEDMIYVNINHNVEVKTALYNSIGNLTKYMEQVESDLIKEIFKGNRGNISKTANELGISRQSLQYKLKKFGIR